MGAAFSGLFQAVLPKLVALIGFVLVVRLIAYLVRRTRIK